MNKTLLVILALTALGVTTYLVKKYHKKPTTETQTTQTIPTPVYDLWTHWKSKHSKSYGSSEQKRLQIFYENYLKVQAHQSDPKRTYDKGFTKFMDLTAQEFKVLYLGTKPAEKKSKRATLAYDGTQLPASVDWRTKGAVTPVKDQAQCGSCWAFSTTGGLEGLASIKAGGLQSFSEQELVDCSGSYGDEGCNGGLMDDAYQYVIDHGITTESKYPYAGVDQTCSQQGGAFKISSFTDVTQGSADALAQAVVQQPISIAVDANNWQLYSGGVFSDCEESLDHGVTLVGYTADYWIVKNSWNTDWGEQGYIRLARGNTCGMANAASFPNL